MSGFLSRGIGALATVFCCVLFIADSLKAQNVAPEASEALWSRIETQLAQQASDTSFQCILPLVRSHCGLDKDCLLRNYFHVVTKLERNFNLPAAIYVCEEIVKIAHSNGAIEEEAQAYLHSCRFHDALGNTRLAAFDIEQSLRLFKQLGHPRKIAMAKYWKLRISLRHRKEEEVSPEMEVLLSEAKLQKDTGLLVRLHKVLADQNYLAAQYEKTTEHLDALEGILKNKPLLNSDQYYQMFVYRCRGDIARAAAQWEDAKRFYEKALLLSQSIPDRWVEIKCLQVLAELDWELGNNFSAKSYIEKAHNLAWERNLEDLLIYSFGVKARFAEAEGQYAEALQYLKKMREHEVRWENRASGSNAENYFLEVENENKKLELDLKNNQLRYSLLVASLILLLATGIFLAYRKQRQDKRKLSEQNTLIQRQSEQLKSLDTAKSHFFANVSHELRTPLALMLGPIGSLLKEKQLTEKQTNLLQLAQQSSKQLEQLVTDILDLGKLEMGKMELDEKPTEVASFFRSYFAQFESLAESRHIVFSFGISVGDDVLAHLDQAKCRQILNNLLSNAFKFTPAGERVEAKLSLINGHLQLTVTDTGPGIHPDDLPHLFDRYFQTTRPDKPAEGGTGIGLALCNEYVQLFGGKIEVESTLGEGTLFRVLIPVKHAESAKISDFASETLDSDRESVPAPIVAPAFPVDKSKPSILVVEDNPDLQAFIRLILSEKYNIVTAENGQAALKVMGYELGDIPESTGLQITHNASLITPDLVLSDLMMPVMDGLQLLEKLKSTDTTRHIPVIMLTARADARDKLKALRIGVDDYLLKPFDEEELLARIENLLKNQTARRKATALESVAHLQAAPHLSQPDREWLEGFEGYVQKHLSKDILSVSALAQTFAMSESTLLRQLKRLTGLSPIQYLQEMRLDEARRLLENQSYDSIAKVASKVGYEDARSFSRSFKQRFGKLPSEMMGA